MKLGLLGFTGNTITDRTANLGIYRPESNEHIQSFNGGPECYVKVGESPTFELPIGSNADITGLFIGGDGADQGKYVFVYENTANCAYRYTLNTPWDISTLNTTSINGSRNLDQYLIDQTRGTDKTNINPSYVLGASTAGSTLKNYYELKDGQGIRFSPDGTKMHILDGNSGYCKIVQFTLNTAWDLSTVSFIPPGGGTYGGTDFGTPNTPIFWTISGTNAGTQQTGQRILPYKHNDRDFCFSDDGQDLYVLGTRRYGSPSVTITEQVTRWKLRSGRDPFDIGSYNYSGVIPNALDMGNQGTANYTYESLLKNLGTYETTSPGYIRGMCVNKNSNKMYLIGTTKAVLYGLNYNNFYVGAMDAPTVDISSTGDASNNMSYVGALNSGEREPQAVFMSTQNNNMDFYIVGNSDAGGGTRRIYQYKLVLK
jgi:hypothetical protein